MSLFASFCQTTLFANKKKPLPAPDCKLARVCISLHPSGISLTRSGTLLTQLGTPLTQPGTHRARAGMPLQQPESRQASSGTLTGAGAGHTNRHFRPDAERAEGLANSEKAGKPA